MAENQEIQRSYTDNYAIKEFVSNTLVPKYFPDIDVSLRTIGMVGLTTELISNIAEDSFNATSVLFRESFPNRAELPESIYSHASIFKLSNIFSSASVCSFLIVIEENSIINNMVKQNNGMYYFYIDKNTTVYVENTPYVLDYDIRIRCVKKETSNSMQYIFTAAYVLDEYTNSISNIIDPYIKIRRSSNGFIALEVKMHQMTRDIHYESIINNSKINMPSIDIPFDGQLVGFDVLYKTPEETSYNTQLQKLMIYSQPSTAPFCYYQLHDDNTLTISFNARDGYFTPKFNSELQIILYLSNGKSANFDAYTGTNITIVPDNTVYSYDQSVAMVAKPLSGSTGGADRMTVDELQALTVEGYRTANALTTESDLSTYFSNYKTSYGDFSIKFIKRRNDVYERIFGGYCIMRYESEIFKTNTLDIYMNLSDMEQPDSNIYMIEPGTVFTYSNNTDTPISFYRDPEKYNRYYNEYLTAKEKNEIPFIENADESIPEYLKDRVASYAEFKKRKGYNDKTYVFDITDTQAITISDQSNLDFRFINPFLIRFKKSPNLVSLYQTYINEKSTVDFTNQNDDAFVQFVSYQLQVERYFEKNKEYKITTSVMPSITLDDDYPVIANLGPDPVTGETRYNINNKYTVDQNDLRVLFVIYNNTNNTPICYSEMYPIEFTDQTNVIYETRFSTDDYITSDNKLRLFDGTIYLVVNADSISDRYTDIQNGWYFKVTTNSASYNLYDNNDVLQQENISINIITELLGNENNPIKKFSQLVHMSDNGGDILIPMENVVCKVFTLYNKKYNEDSSALEDIESSDTNNSFIKYDNTYDKYIWTNEYSTLTEPLTFIKTLTHVRSHLYFEDFTETEEVYLVINASALSDSYTNIQNGWYFKVTKNDNTVYNLYDINNRLVQENISINNINSMESQDYIKKDNRYIHDIMDVRMESVPFIKWGLARNSDTMSTFMTIFTTQYENLVNIINEKLRNETSIDCKFYNTYGRSSNYFIGDDEEPLNTLNLRIGFDIWFISGTDTSVAVSEIKQFIKEKIETIYDNGTNQIHISNLMRDIEYKFNYVDHIRFLGFNDYSTDYQSIKLKYTDIDEMSKEDRRKYVPELLVIDIDDIVINEYEI